MAQRVKDQALSLLWLGLLTWCGCDPWPGTFSMPWAWPEKLYSSETFNVYFFISWILWVIFLP